MTENNKTKQFALIVTDGEVGGIQEFPIDAKEALEIWDLLPYVVAVPEEMHGVVEGGWYYKNGKFVPASERDE